MKRILCMVVVMLVAVMVEAQTGSSNQNPASSGQSMPSASQSNSSTAQGASQSTSGSADDQQLIGVEQQWAQAEKSGDAATVGRIEADNYVFTDPSGKITGKQDDVNGLKSGKMKFQTFELSDLQPHVTGNTAVVTGRATVQGTDNGKDVSGTYAFTDTFVKKDGQWQAVATQSTPISGGNTSMPATSAPPPPQR